MIVAATNFPLRLAAAQDFARVREFFRLAAFDDRTVCHALAINNPGELGRVSWDTTELNTLSAPLSWCIRIFLRGLPAGEAESRATCGREIFDAFQDLGLLRCARKEPSAVVCPVWVYPVDGFVVASDRRDDPDGEPYTPPEDVVFPAIYAGTLRFLQLLTEACGREALDLCGGSGIGALHFSRTARSVVTADLAERSALFAEFNACLNGVALESLCGDLYEPVRGRKFDVISAHPPFVPATGQNMVYRDGGDTGEEVTRRIVEGLPAHLRPGGVCVILCVACDANDKTFEQRAHDWLGDDRDLFDVVYGLEKVLSVEEVVESIRKRGQHLGKEATQQLFARLQSFGTRQFVYGALVIRRLAERVGPAPYRTDLTPEGNAADFERLLAWRSHSRRPDFVEWLARSRPRLAPRLQLTARHLVQNGELVPAEFVFTIEKGFQAALRPDAWVVPLIARLDGRRSVREVFEAALAVDELPQGFPLEAFVDLAQRMIARGFLEVEFPPESR